MKRFLKVIALMAAFMVISAPAWSLHYDDHVSISGSGQGDVLIYPVYVGSDGGNQTKIQVINTSLDMSAVVKIVVRSALYSQECRDFFIFLSPTDMWEGTLMWKDGETVIWTDDDSFLTSSAPTFASKANPFMLPMIEPGCDDYCNLGYVEAFLSWVFPNLSAIPTDKERIFDEYVGTGSLGSPVPFSGFAPGERGGFNTNILAGNLEVQSTLVNWNAALNAVALKDYGNLARLNPAIETIFGEAAQNSMDEVEAALNINNVAMPYYNRAGSANSHHLFTFPTKLTIIDADCNITGTEGNYTGFGIGSPADDWVQYSVRAMDMKENVLAPGEDIFSPQEPGRTLTFPYELNAVFPNPRFTEGWYRYRFTEGDTTGRTAGTLGLHAGATDWLRYTGAPAIPVVMNWGEAGLSLKYGSSEEGFFIDDTGLWRTSGGGKVFGTLDGSAGGVRTGLPGYQFSRMTPNT